MSLFNLGEFTLHSGGKTNFLIDCNALTDEDLAALAAITAEKFKFHKVVGIPSGGLRFAQALQKYCTNNEEDGILVADDVCTTGKSFKDFVRENYPDLTPKGVVIFNRGTVPNWVYSIFYM